jgi:hypothetical protein
VELRANVVRGVTRAGMICVPTLAAGPAMFVVLRMGGASRALAWSHALPILRVTLLAATILFPLFTLYFTLRVVIPTRESDVV